VYHATEPDLILGAITTNLAAATAPVDYVLADWRTANLKFPSAFKPIVFTVEPSLVAHLIGRLSARDLGEIERRVQIALEMTTDSFTDASDGFQHSQSKQMDRIIRNALAEDIGDGDVTTLNTIPESAVLMGQFLAKADGVVAGLAVVQRVFELLDAHVQITQFVHDGDRVQVGQAIAAIRGPGRAILTGERVALNLLQRMSGIATLTRRYVDTVAGTQAVILDTRKTAPGLRVLDKWAVRLGGGQNHRIGLYDMAMIKDNHIAAVGGIAEAVRRVRAGDPRGRPIEVEVTDLEQLREALDQPIDRILLDNMSLAQMREAVQIAAGRVPLEASGNVSLDTVAAIAATGVDYISSGALTHSVMALDISLDIMSET
jgi:nicotinate-nucleotide pyrophosphorylase (carboxylating)